MEQKRKKDSEVVQEEVSCAGDSNKKGEEDHGKMEQLVSTSQSGKRVEDRQGKEDYEFFGPQRSKKKHEVIRENEDKNEEKKPRKDEGQKQNEKEDERKRRTQKRLRKRSQSKELREFSVEKEEKDIKIRRKLKAESADPDSADESDL